MAQHRQTLFFGIAGGSGCGKTHLARRVRELAGADHVEIISMDQYFLSSGPERA
jgi:uridine kinase